MIKNKVKIVLIDEHQLFREGLKRVLQAEPSFDVIVSSDHYSVVDPLINSYDVNVLLIDVKIFNRHKTVIKEKILNAFPVKVIVLSTAGEENDVTTAVQMGVHGYLLKEMDVYTFIDAIKTVLNDISYIHPLMTEQLVNDYRKLTKKMANEPLMAASQIERPLHLYTKRECEVLQLLAHGKSNRKIAETLQISEKTVKNHVSSLFKKMNVNDRTNAVVTAIRNHWVEI